MEIVEVFEKPKCKRCGSSVVRVRVNGSIICYRCGYVDESNKKEKDK